MVTWWVRSRAQPRLIVVAEFAALGPALNLVVGGQDGVERYRQAVRADEVRFIPLYRAVLAALLRRVPAGALLGGLVDRAVEHDHRENPHLMAAFDLLDPPGGTQPRVWVASRHTGPAALHAGVKFALLLPVVVPAVAVAAGLALRPEAPRWSGGVGLHSRIGPRRVPAQRIRRWRWCRW